MIDAQNPHILAVESSCVFLCSAWEEPAHHVLQRKSAVDTQSQQVMSIRQPTYHRLN